MSENFTEAFDIKANFHTACREGMAQRMKINRRNGKFPQYAFEMILHGSRFQEMMFFSVNT